MLEQNLVHSRKGGLDPSFTMLSLSSIDCIVSHSWAMLSNYLTEHQREQFALPLPRKHSVRIAESLSTVQLQVLHHLRNLTDISGDDFRRMQRQSDLWD